MFGRLVGIVSTLVLVRLLSPVPIDWRHFVDTGLFSPDALDTDILACLNAGQLARERYQRNLDELNEHLRDSAKILIDINSAKRNQLDAAIAGSQVTAQESERNIVKPDEEHVIWPFDGSAVACAGAKAVCP